ncbi:MAG TPA: hypothetical protein VE993_19300 [Stellaceae bacterium]|nr:hypothetical protein [Stellaceae bacterium]
MADYWTPTVIHQTIPDADMTPLERLLLTRIFNAEPDGDGLYFYAEEGPSDLVVIGRGELEEALAASRAAGDSRAAVFVAEQLAQLGEDEAEVELDLSGSVSWEAFLQDILRRSPRLRYVSMISSFTCSRMRPDGFGGMAVLITAERVLAKSTGDLIAELLEEAGLEA